MITQSIIDFFRDLIVSWVSGFNSLLGGIDAESAGAAVGGVADSAGHFLALFIDPSVWPGIVTAWASWLAVWLVTGIVAIIGRRLSS